MAKKAFSIDELSTLITDDFAWRRKELHFFKSKIPRESDSSQKPFLRAGVAILYAHWEGFIKNALSYYLQHVSYRSLKYSELKSQFIALCLANRVNKLEIKKIQTQTQVIDFIIDELGKKANIPYEKIINTKSNLNFNVLKDILFTVGLDGNIFVSKEGLINDLIDTRNTIAHGESKEITLETYNLFYSDIVQLMEQIKDEIENSAVLEYYKR